MRVKRAGRLCLSRFALTVICVLSVLSQIVLFKQERSGGGDLRVKKLGLKRHFGNSLDDHCVMDRFVRPMRKLRVI